MGISWAFVFLILYPALQVPAVWYVVKRYDLRNDDGPAPVGYSFHESVEGSAPGECRRCGADNDPDVRFCGQCLAPLERAPGERTAG